MIPLLPLDLNTLFVIHDSWYVVPEQHSEISAFRVIKNDLGNHRATYNAVICWRAQPGLSFTYRFSDEKQAFQLLQSPSPKATIAGLLKTNGLNFADRYGTKCLPIAELGGAFVVSKSLLCDAALVFTKSTYQGVMERIATTVTKRRNMAIDQSLHSLPALF